MKESAPGLVIAPYINISDDTLKLVNKYIKAMRIITIKTLQFQTN